LEDTGVDGRIILRWTSRNCDVGTWAGLIWLRMCRGGRNLLKQNGRMGSIKHGKLVD